MSLSGSICNASWEGRKVNVIDTPGDAGFVADSLSALRVTETALIVVNGVAGIEVQTGRQWARANAIGRARLLFVNMLDRDRADFDMVVASLQEQLAPQCVPLTIPIGSEQELSGVIDVLNQRAFSTADAGKEEPVDVPDGEADRVEAAREQLVEAVVETDEAVMERYLEGEEIGSEELLGAPPRSGGSRRAGFPSCAAPPRRTSAAHRCSTRSPASRLHPRTFEAPVRGRRSGGVHLHDSGRPVRRPNQRASRVWRRRAERLQPHQCPRELEGARRAAARVAGEGPRLGRRPRRRRHRRPSRS